MRILTQTKRTVMVINLIVGTLWMPSLAAEAKEVEQDEIVKLIDQLGNPQIQMRDETMSKLGEIPPGDE